jgi:hypothetical protein
MTPLAETLVRLLGGKADRGQAKRSGVSSRQRARNRHFRDHMTDFCTVRVSVAHRTCTRDAAGTLCKAALGAGASEGGPSSASETRWLSGS